MVVVVWGAGHVGGGGVTRGRHMRGHSFTHNFLEARTKKGRWQEKIFCRSISLFGKMWEGLGGECGDGDGDDKGGGVNLKSGAARGRGLFRKPCGTVKHKLHDHDDDEEG